VSFLPARGEFPEVSSCDSSGQGKTRAPSKISETYAKYCVQTAQQFLGSTPRRKLRSHKRGQSQKSRDSKAPAVQLVCARIKSRTTKVKSYKSQEQQKPGNVSVWLTSQSTDITKYCHPERSEGPAFAAPFTLLPLFLFKVRHYQSRAGLQHSNHLPRRPTIADRSPCWPARPDTQSRKGRCSACENGACVKLK